MPTCSTCGSSFDNASRFCPKCGLLPQQAKSFSYSGSVMLGIALLALAAIWKVVSLAPSATMVPAVTLDPPDDAAVLVTNCGQPDADNFDVRNGTQGRSLLYQKAKVKAVFTRSDSSARWKMQAMLDLKTLKPLMPDKLARRMPCTSSKASSDTVNQTGVR